MESTFAELRSIREARLEVSIYKGRISARIGRRREQNRLNQRACRLRKRIQHSKEESQSHASTGDSPYGVLVPSRCTASTMSSTTPDAYQPVVHLSLQLPNWLILTQLNVWQATLINSLILGMSHFFTNEEKSSDNHHDDDEEEDLAYLPHYLSPPPSHSSSPLPPSLHPTPLQQSTPHYPWIDLFPHAGMRDTLIRAGSRLDVHDFCADILGSMFDQSLDRNESGFMVWGESWLVDSWEMSEGFVRKYAWLLEDKGCQDMMRATNCWRERRGEELLLEYM